jgi:hypothetical protein
MNNSTKNGRARAQAQHRLAHLQRRFQAGDDVALGEVFEAAGLTAQERHVVRERVTGRSYLEVAAALPKPGGGRYSRQRVQQIEAEATAKLGLAESLAETVHRAERVERALDLVEHGERVRAADLHLDPEQVGPRLQRRVAQWEREHEAAVQAFLKEAEHARREGVNPALAAEVGQGG